MPGERTERATFKRHEDARKKGQAYQSQDLTGAAVVLGTFGALKAMGPAAQNKIADGMTVMLQNSDNNMAGPRDIASALSSGVGMLTSVLLPVFAASVLVGTAATLAQTRFLVSPAQLSPKWERISPVQGFKRLFSLRSFVEMVKSLLKMAIILFIIWTGVQGELPQIFQLFDVSLSAALSYIGGLTVNIGLRAGAAMLAIGIADYFYQWWEYERNLMMTKQEVKDEFKQTEGNPQIKSRIRNLQRRLSRMRMIKAVPNADVVIRNPTHYAVALKYDAKLGRAPVVLAKGVDTLALKIVEIAEQNHVYITENRPLARGLYQAVEVGAEIPAEFYKAVAEILAYIYRLRKAGRR